MKVADNFPAKTVTVFGTAAAVTLLDKLTLIPPTLAGSFNVTVPVDDIPPMTLDGLNPTD
jgi:hypothetical protein